MWADKERVEQFLGESLSTRWALRCEHTSSNGNSRLYLLEGLGVTGLPYGSGAPHDVAMPCAAPMLVVAPAPGLAQGAFVSQ